MNIFFMFFRPNQPEVLITFLDHLTLPLGKDHLVHRYEIHTIIKRRGVLDKRVFKIMLKIGESSCNRLCLHDIHKMNNQFILTELICR